MLTNHTSEWESGSRVINFQWVERIDSIETEGDCTVIYVRVGNLEETERFPGPFSTCEPGIEFRVDVVGNGKWRYHSTRVL